MVTTDRLAELYKTVLLLEEKHNLAQEALKRVPKTDEIALRYKRQDATEISNKLAAARKEFSSAVTSYNRAHRNIPFYRKSKTYTVKLQSKTVKFFFDQHGIPTTV